MDEETERSERHVTYCSFADETHCAGVVILEGSHDPVTASLIAYSKGLNPGGQLLAIPVSESEIDPSEFAAMWDNRHVLLSPEQAGEMLGARRLGDWEDDGEAMDHD